MNELLHTPASGNDPRDIRFDEPGPPVVPDHELIRCVGRGAYGEVWLARNVMGTFRAVKVVYRRNFQDERPFEREYSGLKRFEPVSRSHESQIDILHIGRSADCFFYVMELADDELSGQEIDPDHYRPRTLHAVHEGRVQYTIDETLEIGLALTTALEHLHQNGLVHRDVKPSNVIFVNGQPKLADIGLVSSVDATRSFVGTEGFVPPEGPGAPTGDIYSLGKVLYELCTGRDRKDYPELPTALAESPDRERLLEMNAVIAKACRESPKDRYASAEAMRQDLLLMQSGKSVRRMQKLERQLWFVRRAGAVVTVLAFLVLAGWLYQARQTRIVEEMAAENFRLAEESQRYADQSQKNAEESQRNAKESNDHVVRLLVANGNRLVDEGDFAGALPWLAEAFKRVEGDSERELTHRTRLESVIGKIPRLMQIFEHDAGVLWCEFSPDGSRIATAGKDHTARVWDVVTGEPSSPLLRHEDIVRRVRFNPDGQRVVTASVDGYARVWDAFTGEQIIPALMHESPVGDAVFSPDGEWVLTTTRGAGYVRVWHARTGERVASDLGGRGRGSVTTACFTPDGKSLLTGSSEGVVGLWDIRTGEPQFRPLSVGSRVHVAAFAADGTRFATGAEELGIYSARIWHATNGRPLTPELPHDEAILRISFSPDGRRLLTTESKAANAVHLWDSATGEALAQFGYASPGGAGVFSPDGQLIAICGEDAIAQVLNSDTLEPAWPPLRHVSWVPHNAFSPNGQLLATASEEGLVRVWSLLTTDHPARVYYDFSAGVATDAVFSPDGSLVLCGHMFSGALYQDNETLHVMPQPNGNVGLVGFSPDGSQVFLAPGRGARGSSVTVWATATGERLWEFAHPAQIHSASFSPDGAHLLTGGGDGTARVWDAATGISAAPPMNHGTNVHYASFSPDGTRVVTAALDGQAIVWDWLHSQQILPPLKHTNFLYCALFSPDGRSILTGGGDQHVHVWDAATGKPRVPPLFHGGSVLGFAFSPDGRAFASWSLAPYAKVWDLASGKQLTPPLEHADRICNVEFSRDGRFIVTGSIDRTARLWDATTGEPISVPLRHGHDLRSARFHPEQSALLTTSFDGAARIWDYNTADWPGGDLVSLATLLSSHEIDPALNPVPMHNEKIMRALEILKARQVNYLNPGPDLQREAHLKHSLDALLRKSWRTAVWHLSALIKTDPDNGWFYELRSVALAELQRWSLARSDHERILELNPNSNPADLLLTTIMAGDLEASRKVAARYQAWLAREENAEHRPDACYHFSCAPGLLDSYDQVLRWSESDSDPFYHGMLWYRLGDHDRALNHFASYDPLQSNIPDAVYYHAMTLWRLGRLEEARVTLALANRRFDRFRRNQSANFSWEHLVVCQLARVEAEELIGKPD